MGVVEQHVDEIPLIRVSSSSSSGSIGALDKCYSELARRSGVASHWLHSCDNDREERQVAGALLLKSSRSSIGLLNQVAFVKGHDGRR